MIRSLAASAVLIVLSTAGAEASVRNFFSPVWNGTPLASCLSGSEGCGKPAADAFCKSNGYDEAVLFQRTPMPMSLAMGSGEMCETGQCSGFRQIKCHSAKEDLATLQ